MESISLNCKPQGLVASAIPANYLERLRQRIREKSLFRGQVTLASGKTSDYYLDCRLTTLDPEGSVLAAHAILELLAAQGIRADAIGGMSIGADPIVASVAALSYLQGRPLRGFLVRKERKEHGRQKRIEGLDPETPGSAVRNVVIVDDVCTTGKSTLEAIAAAEEEGMKITAVISLVDREEGGSELLRKKYPYFAICTARELLAG